MMPSVETICTRQWNDPEFRKKWLVGGLIASIPVVNLLFAGYVLRYMRDLRAGRDLALPQWDDWGDLLLDGLRLVGLKLIYLAVPVVVGAFLSWVLSGLFAFFGMPLFASTLALLPVTVAILGGWLLWMAGIQQWLKREDWTDLLDWQKTFRLAIRMAPALIYPGLAFWGLLVLGWPLLGFIIFLGFMPAVAYATAVYLKVTGAVT